MEIDHSQLDSEVVQHVAGRVFMFNDATVEGEPNRKGEVRCFCPACEALGEPNSKATFYWNVEVLEGFCHRCHAKFVLLSDRPRDQVELELSIRGFLKRADLTATMPSLRRVSSIDYFKIFGEVTEKGKAYLAGRNPVIAPIMKYLAIREIKGVGLTVPLTYKGKIVGYNMRFFEPKGKMKYYIPEGDKLLYSPNQVFNEVNFVEEVTLVEGYFDAIGALLDGFPNPISIQGNHLTDSQIVMLRSIMPAKINIYMDKTELGNVLRKQLWSRIPTMEKCWVIKSDGDDPEERFLWKMANYDTDHLKKILAVVKKYAELGSI